MSTSQTAPASSLEPSAGENQAAVTHEEFLHHMKAMAVHYKAGNSGRTGPTHPYALPIHLVHPVNEEGMMETVQPAVGASKAAVDTVLTNGQTQYKSFAKKQSDFATQQTNKLHSTHDTSSFASQMNAQRTKAKQESDQHIDDMFNKLIDVGTKHPEQQQHILTATQKIGAFITSFLVSVGQFFTSIVNKVMGWINSAVDWVKGAAAAAAKWLSGAVSTVTSFFGSIF